MGPHGPSSDPCGWGKAGNCHEGGSATSAYAWAKNFGGYPSATCFPYQAEDGLGCRGDTICRNCKHFFQNIQVCVLCYITLTSHEDNKVKETDGASTVPSTMKNSFADPRLLQGSDDMDFPQVEKVGDLRESADDFRASNLFAKQSV